MFSRTQTQSKGLVQFQHENDGTIGVSNIGMYSRQRGLSSPIFMAASADEQQQEGGEQPKKQKLGMGSTIKYLVLSGVSGAVAASSCYPIDMVKTRLQNQKTVEGKAPMYNGMVDCAKKIIKADGVGGLYKGLHTQVIGIMPEKAIKLTINEIMREKLTPAGQAQSPVWVDVVAGCTAGFLQVVATNPYELVKIRLQVQSLELEHLTEAEAAIQRKTAVQVIKELGLRGLFRGAGACWLRDIPFTGAYFGCYTTAKRIFTDSDGHLGEIGLMASSVGAGVVAAVVGTPGDVVKTRMQSGGSLQQHGIVDTAREIYAKEGLMAFFKGSGARMLMISPLFGITLYTFEHLLEIFAPEIVATRKK